MTGDPDTTRFSDEAPDDGQEPEPVESSGPDSGRLEFADAAPGTEEELAEVDARQAEQDAASAARAEEARAERRAKRKANYDPAITVDRQEMITVAKGAEGSAICPECKAKCTANAALCLRCGAEIPSAIPGQGKRRGRRHGDYKSHHERRRDADERSERGDAWDMLPEEKQREFREAAEQKEERRADSVSRVRGYRNKVIAGAAGFSAALGLMTSFVSVGCCGPMGFVSLALDAGCGGAAGYFLYMRKGGRKEGLGAFLVVGLVVIGFKLAFGGIDMLLGNNIYGAALFLFYVAHMMALMVGGYFGGMNIEQEFFDSHS